MPLPDKRSDLGNHAMPVSDMRAKNGDPQQAAGVPQVGPGMEWMGQQESRGNDMPVSDPLEKNLAGLLQSLKSLLHDTSEAVVYLALIVDLGSRQSVAV